MYDMDTHIYIYTYMYVYVYIYRVNKDIHMHRYILLYIEVRTFESHGAEHPLVAIRLLGWGLGAVSEGQHSGSMRRPCFLSQLLCTWPLFRIRIEALKTVSTAPLRKQRIVLASWQGCFGTHPETNRYDLHLPREMAGNKEHYEYSHFRLAPFLFPHSHDRPD